MSVRVSFAGREILRVPEDLAGPLEELLDSLGVGGWERDQAGRELAIASPLEGRAVGLWAAPGDEAAAGVVAGLRDRLSRAGALVRQAPGDVCLGVRSRPPGARARGGVRVLHGLFGCRAHRRLAVVLAEHVASMPGGGGPGERRPALSLSAGRWLGRRGGWQRPSALVEFPGGGNGAGCEEACVRGAYQALLRYFAAHQSAAGPAPLPVTPPPPPKASRSSEPEAPASVTPIRVSGRTGLSCLHFLLLPPGESASQTWGAYLGAATGAGDPATRDTPNGRPEPPVGEEPGCDSPGRAPHTPAPPSTGRYGFWEHDRRPWFTGRWSQ